MKKIFIILSLISAVFISGCFSDNSSVEEKTTFGSFNNQTYVWESFIFPTNRVIDRK